MLKLNKDRRMKMTSTIEKIKKHKNELKKYKTPLYVYDFDIINKRCTEMIDFKEK